MGKKIEELLNIKKPEKAEVALTSNEMLELGMEYKESELDIIKTVEDITEIGKAEDKLQLLTDDSFESLERASRVIENSPLDGYLEASTESIAVFNQGLKSRTIKAIRVMVQTIDKWLLTLKVVLTTSDNSINDEYAVIMNSLDIIPQNLKVTDKDLVALSSFRRINNKLTIPFTTLLTELSQLKDVVAMRSSDRSFIKEGFVLKSSVKNIELPTSFTNCKYIKYTPIGNGKLAVLGYTLGASDLKFTVADIKAIKGTGETTSWLLDVSVLDILKVQQMSSDDILNKISDIRDLQNTIIDELTSEEHEGNNSSLSAMKVLCQYYTSISYGLVNLKRDATKVIKTLVKYNNG